MKQMTLATAGFGRYGKTARRAVFLAEMEQVVPWREPRRLIDPVYPKSRKSRLPVGLKRMLRRQFLQQWFNLPDPAVEEALYESVSMQRFAGIGLGRRLFEEVHRHLEAKDLKVARGTIVDATTISAPSSTKNADKARIATSRVRLAQL